MKRPRCTDQQIAQALRWAELGTAAAEFWSKLGVSETTFTLASPELLIAAEAIAVLGAGKS